MTRPRDSANLCSVFSQLKTSKLREKDLSRAVERSFAIDCRSSAEELMRDGEHLGLIRRSSGDVYLEPSGRVIAKIQRETVAELSSRTKSQLLKSVHLNPPIALLRHADFLSGLRVDPVRETLIYPRDPTDRSAVERSLLTFSELGLIDVSPELAIVRKEHLPGVNTVLAAFRDAEETLFSFDGKPDLEGIGRVAELQALHDERERLTDLGCKDLAILAYRISTIDSSAGYDLVSYDGTAPEPERPRYIEVKGTTGATPQFVWTRNERRVAESTSQSYWIYIYTSVDVARRRCKGPTRIQDPCRSLRDLGYSMDPLDVMVRG